MDRQRMRVAQSVDGFNRVPNRPQYSIDGFYRPSKPAAQPQLRPRLSPNPNSSTSPAPRPTINRSVPPTAQAPLGPNVRSYRPQGSTAINSPSLLNAALPSANYSRQGAAAKSKKWSKKRKIKTFALSFACLILAFGGWFGYSIVGNLNKVFHGNVFSDAHALMGGSNLKESNGRVNILLAGDSVGDPGHSGASLYDSIMVVSINAQNKTGFIMSIPRDLWVHVDGMGYQKINAAGDANNFSSPGYPNGGIGELQKIVQSDLGIPIDYSAVIDYTAFKDAVNAVGGISIDIQSPDPRGIYDAYTHLRLPNGMVDLTGQQALNLARARGDGAAGDVSYGLPNSDFSRTQHQRQMLTALFSKATSLGVLSNPLKISGLMNAFGNNIQTDLSLSDVLAMVHLTNGLNVSKLQSATYSYGGHGSLLSSYTDPRSHQESLIPALGIGNYSGLQQYYQQLSSSNPMVQEAPSVTVLNGSDVVGLAAKEKQALENAGFNVTSIADASTEYPSTMIVSNASSSKPAALNALQKNLATVSTPQVVNSPSASKEAAESANYSSDFTVILGKDWDNAPIAR